MLGRFRCVQIFLKHFSAKDTIKAKDKTQNRVSKKYLKSRPKFCAAREETQAKHCCATRNSLSHRLPYCLYSLWRWMSISAADCSDDASTVSAAFRMLIRNTRVGQEEVKTIELLCIVLINNNRVQQGCSEGLHAFILFFKQSFLVLRQSAARGAGGCYSSTPSGQPCCARTRLCSSDNFLITTKLRTAPDWANTSHVRVESAGRRPRGPAGSSFSCMVLQERAEASNCRMQS